MGLSICYELRMPPTTPDAEVIRRLEQLRSSVTALSVDAVTELIQLSSADLMRGNDCFDRLSVPWFVHITAHVIREERDGTANEIDEPDRLGAAAFLVHPGRGSEAALFGLVRPHRGSDWFWHHCCKTQYASAVSDEHFVQCHLAIVAALEKAQRLGFGVTVHDEGHYWETRSTDRLIAEVTNMNRLVARFAGAFHDAAPNLNVEASIFEHPDFERLETEPLPPRATP